MNPRKLNFRISYQILDIYQPKISKNRQQMNNLSHESGKYMPVEIQM
jgi:hypothetical protein